MIDMALAVAPHDRDEPENGFLTAAAVWNAEDSHSDLSDLLVVHEELRLTELGTIAGPEAEDVRCALHLSASPRERRRVLAALSAVPGLSNIVGIEAPVALFASQWHQHPVASADQPLRVVAFEHGEVCSMLVAHTGQRRILSIGVVESRQDIEDHILKAIRISEPAPPDPIVAPGMPWANTLELIESVQTVGLEANFTALFTELFGSMTHAGDPGHAVLYGLTRVEALADWTASWPTTRVHLGDGWTRQPGPLRATVEEHLTRLRPAAGLRFSDGAGRDVPVRAGSVVSTGCVIPERLGTQPRLRLVDDGRLLMLGPPGTRPLAIELAWPIPAAQRVSYIGIRSASSVGVELASPRTVDEAHTQPTRRALFPEDLSKVDP